MYKPELSVHSEPYYRLGDLLKEAQYLNLCWKTNLIGREGEEFMMIISMFLYKLLESL